MTDRKVFIGDSARPKAPPQPMEKGTVQPKAPPPPTTDRLPPPPPAKND